MKLDQKRFSKALKQKRVIELEVELRVVAIETGVSASTLSRLENGKIPELNTYITLCEWLGVDLKTFIK